ncbi:MAG: TVP38/TMEM64 family protein [Candidatus Brocadiae bacterium]|nr:TVP38/TMEM64 family protein [Candidatus Brocadiia bacterium]
MSPADPAPSRRARTLRLLGLVGLVIAGVVAFRFTPLREYARPEFVRGQIEAVRGEWWAGPAYALVYAAGCLVGFPGTLMTVAGGAAFGPWWGILWVVLGSNLGVNAAFLVARGLGKGWLDEKLKGGRLDALNAKLAGRGLLSVIQVRLIPAIPFNLLNFACGVTKVRWRDYALGSFLGMLPGTVAFVYFSGAVFEALTSGAQTEGARRATWISLGTGGALFVLSLFLPRLLRASGRAPVDPCPPGPPPG